jgi:hypothetical protein
MEDFYKNIVELSTNQHLKLLLTKHTDTAMHILTNNYKTSINIAALHGYDSAYIAMFGKDAKIGVILLSDILFPNQALIDKYKMTHQPTVAERLFEMFKPFSVEYEKVNDLFYLVKVTWRKSEVL